MSELSSEHPSNQQYTPPSSRSVGIDRFEALIFAVIISFIVIGAAVFYHNNNISSQTSAAAATSTDQSTPYTESSGTWTTTHTFTGNGIKSTEIFTVSSDWKILYICTNQDNGQVDGVLGVEVYAADNTLQDVAINATCHTVHSGGETEEHQGGQIYLKINGTGDWTLQIQELQ